MQTFFTNLGASIQKEARITQAVIHGIETEELQEFRRERDAKEAANELKK